MSIVSSDHTIYVFSKVPIVTFMKIAQKTTIVVIEQKAPV
jgi:hypothetical protein